MCSVTRLLHFARTRWVELLVVFLGLAGVVEALRAPDGPGGVSRGPGWLVPFVVIAMALPLLFARRLPFAAPVAALLVALAITTIANGHALSDSLVAFFLLFLIACGRSFRGSGRSAARSRPAGADRTRGAGRWPPAS